MDNNFEIKEALNVRKQMSNYRDSVYLGIAKQLDEQCGAVLKDDLGSQFVTNCSHDIAGEVVRNCFQTSDYYITVDQMAKRLLTFRYDNEYDPLGKVLSDDQSRKNVLNYNELQSDNLDKITKTIDDATRNSKLFDEDRKDDKLDRTGKINYRHSKRNSDGFVYDDLTGKKEEKKSFMRNGKEVEKSNLQADHIQARESARYNERYITNKGKSELQHYWNSSDNMQMMHASANASKGDIRVCNVDGEIKYVNARSKEYDPSTDITYKATPEQLADAVCAQWEAVDETREGQNQKKIQALKDAGYLDEEGKVPKSIRKKLVNNIRKSQNEESKVILKNTRYDKVASDALDVTKSSVGKIIAGQIIYYAAPPIVYEMRCALEGDDNQSLDNALIKIEKAGKRVCDYVFCHVKDIFINITTNSLKSFIKSFMDILINTVKATIKKIMKLAKNLVLSTVDAIKIIADKNSSGSEKADAVFNLYGVTITSCVVEVLFELLGDTLHIPEPFDDIIFGPLQILTTIMCTNLTMLILKKLDIFGVQTGLKISKIRDLFNSAEEQYNLEFESMKVYADDKEQMIISAAQDECRDIYLNLKELDPTLGNSRSDLKRINRLFSMDIDFDRDWLAFIGMV